MYAFFTYTMRPAAWPTDIFPSLPLLVPNIFLTPLVLVTNYSTTPLFTTNGQQTSLFIWTPLLYGRLQHQQLIITSRTCRLS